MSLPKHQLQLILGGISESMLMMRLFLSSTSTNGQYSQMLDRNREGSLTLVQEIAVTAINYGNQSLNVPVVLYFEEKLSVDPGDGLKVIGINFPDKNSMLCRTHARRGFTDLPGWMLESNGKFREFIPLKRRWEWAAPISFLVQLVQSEYTITNARDISVGELRKKLQGVKDDFEEAPQAESLREHLQKYADEEVVSEQLLKDWPI